MRCSHVVAVPTPDLDCILAALTTQQVRDRGWVRAAWCEAMRYDARGKEGDGDS